MMLRVAGSGRRTWSSGAAHGRVRYVSAARQGGLRSGIRRVSAAGVRQSWWERLVDDREFVGSKLLVLAALLAFTALLEWVV